MNISKGLKNLKRAFVILLFLLCLCTACTAETRINEEKTTKEQPPQIRMTKYIKDLTSDELAGRRTGSRGEAKAALYLARHLKRWGIQPAGEENTYFQSFSVGEITPVQLEKRMTLRLNQNKKNDFSENVLGIIPGKSEEIVIISAHYDHLGVIEDNIYPGANDNASGTAILLELVSFLSENTPRYTVLLGFWGGEEAGLLGSNYFTDNFTVPEERINCIINLDSLGNLREDKKLVGWKSCENSYSIAVIEELTKAGWEITWEVTSRHNSDHWPFAKKGIAGFTLLSPYWLLDNHSPEDTIDNIKIELLSRFVDDIKKILI
ncbi:MAG: aminopeptidase [Firmicutes bacterium HGW-Firmicutes-12]|jgi:hypothetical protein|nr:MAG: aminopeptidase [Firmicutes bacterium HGW-Firmicutes-12]